MQQNIFTEKWSLVCDIAPSSIKYYRNIGFSESKNCCKGKCRIKIKERNKSMRNSCTCFKNFSLISLRCFHYVHLDYYLHLCCLQSFWSLCLSAFLAWLSVRVAKKFRTEPVIKSTGQIVLVSLTIWSDIWWHINYVFNS